MCTLQHPRHHGTIGESTHPDVPKYTYVIKWICLSSIDFSSLPVLNSIKTFLLNVYSLMLGSFNLHISLTLDRYTALKTANERCSPELYVRCVQTPQYNLLISPIVSRTMNGAFIIKRSSRCIAAKQWPS